MSVMGENMKTCTCIIDGENTQFCERWKGLSRDLAKAVEKGDAKLAKAIRHRQQEHMRAVMEYREERTIGVVDRSSSMTYAERYARRITRIYLREDWWRKFLRWINRPVEV